MANAKTTVTKSILTILILMTWTTFLTGQNLVQNASFEVYDTCPNSQDQVRFALGWKGCKSTPDYFNSCDVISGFGVPNNWAGYQQASSGSAYCGLSTFASNIPNGRELIGRSLSSPLIIGTKYFVSFQSNLAIAPPPVYFPNYATNKLGALFSTIPYSSSFPAPISNFANVYTNSLLTDTLNWTRIFGSFTADSAYTFLTIGNLFDDLNTDTINMFPAFSFPAGSIFSYYYIDDVCVSTDSIYSANYTGFKEILQYNNFKLYPNPTNQFATLEFNNPTKQNCTLTLYDLHGRLLKTINNITTDKVEIEKESLASGLYFIQLRTEKEIIATCKLTIE